MASNSTHMSTSQHPLHATASAMTYGLTSKDRASRMSHMQRSNEGPADTIAEVSGTVSGGEREDDGAYVKNNDDHPLADPEHSKIVGGLPLISDTFLLQKRQTLHVSRNLERMVHPCGSSAFRYFECTDDVAELTKADFLSSVGGKTPVFVRFSTVTLGREFRDEARNPRGFAIKIYTTDGNYGIAGLDFPVSCCRDPIQEPDVIWSQARNPFSFLLDHGALFDLLGNTPEANHAGLVFFSDHGTPQGWRFNHGHDCHTFKWVNKQGKFVYINDHFIANHGGQKQFTGTKTMAMCGEDPDDDSKRDLGEVIERGEEIEWKAHGPVMDPTKADPE